jgi:carboxypeptidase family protein
MPSLRSLVVPVLILAATSSPADARQVRIEMNQEVITGEPVPMGRPGRLRTGTGVIRGRVLSTESGSPVRRAQVRLVGGDAGSRTTMTDAAGRYEFGDLPDGRFTITATKSGFVTVQYGQTRPFESGKPIELADKQVLEKADIALPRGSVIAGRIVDEFGDPVTDAMVTALRQQWVGGRRRLINAGRMDQTNDLGQFRLYGLPPGEYYVSASVRNSEPVMLEMIGPPGSTPPPQTPASGYAPTYFPGTPSPADAQRVTIAVGQEAQGTDFALVPARLARVTGVVLSSEGRPVEGAMITAVPSRGIEGAMLLSGTARTTRDGAFTLTNIAPGDYTLQARSMTIMTSGGGDTVVYSARIGGPGAGNSEFGSLPLSVSGEDVSNVVITTSKGATVTGHVTFEGNSPGSGALRVIAVAADPEGPMLGPGTTGGAVKADGTFELSGLTGLRVLRVTGLSGGWSLKRVEANGVDVTDTGIELKGNEAAGGIEIVLSPRSTDINGSVTQRDGTPIKDYTVVVFAEDPQKWVAPATRWITASRPDQDGRFRVRNMPAGSYYAIALDYIPQGEWNDPDLLERLKPRASRFTLEDGDTRTLDLKISEGG